MSNSPEPLPGPTKREATTFLGTLTMMLGVTLTVLAGVGYYGDVLTIQMVIGGLLTFSGVAIITFRSGGVGGEVDFDKGATSPVSGGETADRASPRSPAGEPR